MFGVSGARGRGGGLINILKSPLTALRHQGGGQIRVAVCADGSTLEQELESLCVS